MMSNLQNDNMTVKFNYDVAKNNGVFDNENDPVMYVIINNDIKMDINKMITHCCHSVSKIIRINEKLKPNIYNLWINNFEQKILLKTTEENLLYFINNYSDMQKDIWCQHVLDISGDNDSPFSITAIAFTPILIKHTPDLIKSLRKI